jgi:serine/threonine-protein kinase RsbW
MHDYGKKPRSNAAPLRATQPGFTARSVEANSLAGTLPAFERIEDWMRVLGYPQSDLVAVLLATREAVLNAVRHGLRGDPAKQVRLRYLVTPSEVWIEVEDDGTGFNPASVPGATADWQAQHRRGRGLFLMRSYTDWMTFNPAGNRVTLCRRRTEA